MTCPWSCHVDGAERHARWRSLVSSSSPSPPTAPHPQASNPVSVTGPRGTFLFLPQLFIEPTMCQAIGLQNLFSPGNFPMNTISAGPFLKNWKLWQYWARLPLEQQLAGAKGWLPPSETEGSLWVTSPLISHTESASFPCLAVLVIHLSLQALT